MGGINDTMENVFQNSSCKMTNKNGGKDLLKFKNNKNINKKRFFCREIKTRQHD